MTNSLKPDRPRSETDFAISELARGKAERILLGKNPYGSMMRLLGFILLFIFIFGTIFFVAQQ